MYFKGVVRNAFLKKSYKSVIVFVVKIEKVPIKTYE